MMMQDREYLRISVPYLNVHYNVVSDGKPAPVLVGFSRRTPQFVRESYKDGTEGESAFQHQLIECFRRLEVKLDRLIGYIEKERTGKSYHFRGETIDIGGGGLSFRSDAGHPEGTLMDLCIFPEHGDPTPIFAIGKVCWVRHEGGDREGSPYYMLGVDFVEINEEDQEAIVRMVFQVERMQRRQGLKVENSLQRPSGQKGSK